MLRPLNYFLHYINKYLDILKVTLHFVIRVAHRGIMSSMPVSIEPDEIDDLPAYNPSTSSSQPASSPQPEIHGRIANIAGETASDRRYTGGDTLDEPVSTTIVSSPLLPILFNLETCFDRAVT